MKAKTAIWTLLGAAIVAILVILRSRPEATSEFLHWGLLASAAYFAVLAVRCYMDRPRRRARVAYLASFAIFILTMFLNEGNEGRSSVLAWVGLCFGVIGIVCMYIDMPELYTK